MRLDRFISNFSSYSRSEAKKIIARGKIDINNKKVKDSSYQVKEDDEVLMFGKAVKKFENIYYVLDKPKGYVTSTKEEGHKLVIDLIPEEYENYDLKPVGRLDKDTTGLLILTNDNDFIHKMTSPKNEIEKVYVVTLADPIKDEYTSALKNGIELKDGTKCKSAIMEVISDNECKLTLTEGKYHQVKRMFGALGNKVVELRRIKFGEYELKK